MTLAKIAVVDKLSIAWKERLFTSLSYSHIYILFALSYKHFKFYSKKTNELTDGYC